MRIIAGEFRGRRLQVPSGGGVRPTSDRAKEALFSILANSIDGARVLDMFAGSGALGLEALSRGAKRAVFCEKDPRALAALKTNIATCGAQDFAEVRPGDCLRSLASIATQCEQFDVVFLDPPYAAGLLDPALRTAANSGILAPGAAIIAEHPAGRRPQFENPSWLQWTSRTYGDVGFTLWQISEASGPLGMDA